MSLDTTTRDRLESAYLEEVTNYISSTRLEHHEEQALKAVGQSLLWSCALIEFYRKGISDYNIYLQSHPSRDLVKGIIYSRNRVLHQFIQLVFITDDGAAFPIILPAPFFEIRWKPLKALPLPDKGFEDVKRAKCYEDNLENIPIRFTFEKLTQFFKDINKHVR